MGFRRQKQSFLTKRIWKKFVMDNADLIQKAGLPQAILDSEDYWTDTVVYGYAESAWNPTDAFNGFLPDFNSHKLKPAQYECFFLYNGTLSLFEKQGFERIRRLGKSHWVAFRVVKANPA